MNMLRSRGNHPPPNLEVVSTEVEPVQIPVLSADDRDRLNLIYQEMRKEIQRQRLIKALALGRRLVQEAHLLDHQPLRHAAGLVVEAIESGATDQDVLAMSVNLIGSCIGSL